MKQPLKYQWDDAKAATNLAKHGVPFDIITGFDWQTALIDPDQRRVYGELRWQALGIIGARLYAFVFTVRGDTIRVISLRKANAREQRRFDHG